MSVCIICISTKKPSVQGGIEDRITGSCFQIYKRSSPILWRSGSLRTVPKFPYNIIKLPKDIHRKISGYYSSIQKETDYMRVRDWLNGKSYEFQYEYGLEVLKRYGY
jgi:hypothetical protein